jgi:hypothetical protein
MKTTYGIPSDLAFLRKSLTELPAKITEFGSGFAFLSAQIKLLENRCLAMHRRLEHRHPHRRRHK